MRTYTITFSNDGHFMEVVFDHNMLAVGHHPDIIGTSFHQCVRPGGNFPIGEWQVSQPDDEPCIWDAYASMLSQRAQYVRPEQMVAAASILEVDQQCRHCGGSGTVYVPHQVECPRCEGKGVFMASMDSADVLT